MSKTNCRDCEFNATGTDDALCRSAGGLTLTKGGSPVRPPNSVGHGCFEYQARVVQLRPPAASALPLDSAERKRIPLMRGCFDYFPAALCAVARLSFKGNEKHNPGEPLHWARGKSMDHGDAMLRHQQDWDRIDPDSGEYHAVEVAWRALAQLQELLEKKEGAPMPRGAKLTEVAP